MVRCGPGSCESYAHDVYEPDWVDTTHEPNKSHEPNELHKPNELHELHKPNESHDFGGSAHCWVTRRRCSLVPFAEASENNSAIYVMIGNH
jgi:hypothetical protein